MISVNQQETMSQHGTCNAADCPITEPTGANLDGD